MLALYGQKAATEREIRSAFGRYVSPAVVAQLAAASRAVLQLGGEERALTLMFCDLRSLHHALRGPDRDRTHPFLNEYLTPMTDAVLGSSGTVDKYMGDAIMAFWNAPLDDDATPRTRCARRSDMRARARRAQRALGARRRRAAGTAVSSR